jgi:hypothetical protein
MAQLTRSVRPSLAKAGCGATGSKAAEKRQKSGKRRRAERQRAEATGSTSRGQTAEATVIVSEHQLPHSNWHTRARRPARPYRPAGAGPVTPTQRRATELLARGLSQAEVGRLVGRSPRTIRAWLHEVEGFREAARTVRVEPGEPTAEETLRQALSANRPDGSPDWSIRVQAARVLSKAQPTPEQADRFVQVVFLPDGTIIDDAGVVERHPAPDAEPQPLAAS